MEYESPISFGKEVMVNIKVFVHAADAEADADARATT